MAVSLRNLTIGGALCVMGSVASAQSAETPCGALHLFPRYITAESVTAKDGEVSFGDTRFVHITLVDENETDIAQFIHTAVVIPGGDEARHNLLLDGHLVFPDGTIGVSGIYHRPNLTSNKPEAAREFSLALHAGTGRFVGYSGEVRLFRNAEDERVYLLELPCD